MDPSQPSPLFPLFDPLLGQRMGSQGPETHQSVTPPPQICSPGPATEEWTTIRRQDLDTLLARAAAADTVLANTRGVPAHALPGDQASAQIRVPGESQSQSHPRGPSPIQNSTPDPPHLPADAATHALARFVEQEHEQEVARLTEAVRELKTKRDKYKRWARRFQEQRDDLLRDKGEREKGMDELRARVRMMERDPRRVRNAV